MLRVVTLNTWKCDGDYGARMALMRRELKHLDVDVLCLQECFSTCPSLETGGRDLNRPAAHTSRDLAEALGMRLYHVPARRKVRRFLDGPVLSTSGLAILVRAKAGPMDVLDLPQDSGDGPRVAQAIDLFLKDAGAIRVVNLHLTHLRDREDLRASQLQSVLDRWGQAGLPTLIAGDFNAAFDDDAFRALRDRNDLDIGPLSHQQWPGTLLMGSLKRAIDHVLLLRGSSDSAPVVTARRRVLDRRSPAGLFPSDHAGVLVDLSWPDKAGVESGFASC